MTKRDRIFLSRWRGPVRHCIRCESMNESNWLAQQFEENRGHLRGVAYRMLGSLSEADDAVQETWLKLSRSEPGSIQNLSGWLTTVIARVCLDMLRSRKSRAEESIEEPGANTHK